MTTFVNLTPHTLTVSATDGQVISIAPSGTIARCSQSVSVVDTVTVDGHEIQVTSVILGDVTDLPDPEEGTVFIVSRLVADKMKDSRKDLLIPGPLLRDKEGKVIGCDGFTRI